MRLSEDKLKPPAWYLKPFFWNQIRKYGQPLEPAKVWAIMPRLFMGVAWIYGVLDRKSSPLSAELKSLINLRVSQMNGCEFCMDMNIANYLKRSKHPEKIEHLREWKISELFTAPDKAALDHAEKMTDTNQQVTDASFQQLKQHFSENAIVELTALIAFQNMSSKFNHALDIKAQGLCKSPPH